MEERKRERKYIVKVRLWVIGFERLLKIQQICNCRWECHNSLFYPHETLLPPCNYQVWLYKSSGKIHTLVGLSDQDFILWSCCTRLLFWGNGNASELEARKNRGRRNMRGYRGYHILSEVRQRKMNSISLIYMQSKKKSTNKLIYKTETNSLT